MSSFRGLCERRTGTYHVYLPRRAVGHVLEAPITHPQDTTRIVAVDRASKKVHRAAMSDSVLAFSVRQWVRGEVPASRG